MSHTSNDQTRWEEIHEVQPKSSLSIPPGMRTYYQGLQDSMEQLVRKGRLQQFLYRPNGQGDQAMSGA